MTREEYITNFRVNYDLFLQSCDSVEESGAWNQSEKGEMSVYFTADLMGLAVYLMSADGLFTSEEALMYGDMFDCESDPEELKEIYDNYYDVIDDTIEHIGESYEDLSLAHPEAAECYKTLVKMLAQMIAFSDNTLSSEEEALMTSINHAIA